MAEILSLIQGATEISLINGTDGIHLEEWIPNVSTLKDGGVVVNSPMMEGRIFTYGVYDSVDEVFRIDVVGESQSLAIQNLAQLKIHLDNGNGFWLGNSSSPLYLKAKFDLLTSPVYAVVVSHRLGTLSNLFGRHFNLGSSEGPALTGIELAITRGHWQDTIPGTANAIEIGVSESYGGRSFGNVNSSGGIDFTSQPLEAYIDNHRKVSNLTHIFRFDASAGTFSSNLLDASLPYNLFPDPVDDGDICYFGSESPAGSTPGNLVFDLSNVADPSDLSIWWEVYDGSWQLTQPDSDFTSSVVNSSFNNSGINNISGFLWGSYAKIPVAINGVTAYWIRARASVGGTATETITQRNRNVYTVAWPYIDIKSSQVTGEIEALARMLLYLRQAGIVYRYIIGRRRLSRGLNFSAYINTSDKENPTGITVGDVNGSFNNSTDFPTGRDFVVSGVSGTTIPSCRIFIDESVAGEYSGLYRIFLRGWAAGGSFDGIYVGYEVAFDFSGNLDPKTIFTSQLYQFINSDAAAAYSGPETQRDHIVDMGLLDLRLLSNQNEQLSIWITINVLAEPTQDLHITDIILMPADDFIAEYNITLQINPFYNVLDVDSAGDARDPLKTTLLDSNLDGLVSVIAISSTPLNLTPYNDQRLWYLLIKEPSTLNLARTAPSRFTTSPNISIAQRYLGFKFD